MKQFISFFMLTLSGLATFAVGGCGESEKGAAFVSATPPNDSSLNSSGIITVTFDNTPVGLELEGKPDKSYWWELDGKVLTIRGNPTFSDGYQWRDHVFTVSWATGRKILIYTVPPRKPNVPAVFLSANPPAGSEVAANGTISVTFDNPPAGVAVIPGTVTVTGKTATITGPFTPGRLALTIRWDDGSQTIHYTVIPSPD